MANEGVIRRPITGEVNGDGSEARYCTVDDPFTGAGTGAVDLPENGRVVTVFNRICTDFTQRAIGDEFRIEAVISQIIQSVGLVKASDPQNDIQIVSTLFQNGTVKIVGNVPQGTPIFRSPPIFVGRRCGTPTYDPKSPGFARTVTGHEALTQADPIGMITFSWHYGVPC
jgi:hypothetical protein